MAAVILHGIIINVIDYDVYDQIITILLPSNLKVALISKGSRKILSKNGRLISILNQVELSCFLASDIKKISKLKKIENCISFDWNYLSNQAWQIYLDYLAKTPEVKQDFYQFYFILDDMVKNKLAENLCICYVYRLIFEDLGLYFNFTKCIVCGKSMIHILSTELCSVVCKWCNPYHEVSYPQWFLLNFYYFMKHQDYKIKFNHEDEAIFFYNSVKEILRKLLLIHGGYGKYQRGENNED